MNPLRVVPSRRLLGVASIAVATFVASCDSPTRPPQFGSIAPAIALVQADSATRASIVLPLTGVRATVIGPTNRIVNLQQSGTVWTGRADSLQAGMYEVVVEGLAAGEVQYYGRSTNVNVARGPTTSPSVIFAPAVAVVQDPPLPNTTNFSQRITFGAISAATGYVVQLSRTPDFSSGVIEFTTGEANPLVTVTDVGTWYVRTRPILPNTSSPVGWSIVREFDVVPAVGGRSEGNALGKTLVSLAPDTTRNRNITVDEREDFYAFPARAGDSLFVETFAARLPLASGLNTVLTLSRADGTTIVAENDNITGSTDSRIVAVAPATETYRVRVTGASGSSGHYEIVMELRRLPEAPSSLIVTATSGTAIALSWTDNADNEDWFDIERCAGAACADFAVVDSVAAGETAFADTTVGANNTYRYRIRARNAVGRSNATAIATVSTQGPTAPSGLTATTVSGTRIDLAWDDNSDNEAGFRVERCTGAACDFSTVTAVATLAANTEAYSDVSAAVDQTYGYRIVAFNGVADSDPSNTATANTIRPDAPTGLAATVMNTTRVDLAWTFAGTADRVLIERCDGEGCTTFAAIDSVLPGVTAFSDLTPTGSAIHRYRARARNIAGFSDASNIVAADVRLPAAPTNFTATTASATRIDLAWTDNADNELEYDIQRCTGVGCSDFPDLFSSAAGATALADETVTAGQSYTYRIRARAAAGYSAFAAAVTASTEPPVAPTALVATTVSAARIDLTWGNNASPLAGTRVERCSSDACTDFAEIAFVTAPEATYSDTDVTEGSSYRYRLRAQNAADVSDYTSIVEASTAFPAVPQNLAAETNSPTQINLTWDASAGPAVVGYLVERCSGAGCSDFAVVDSLGSGATAYEDGGLSTEGDFVYRVTAVNAVGRGAPSAEVAADTRSPAAPTGLAAAAVPGAIALSWTANADNAAATELERRCITVGCEFAPLATIPVASGATYRDESVGPNEVWAYRLRVTNAVAASGYSNEATASTPLAAPPSGLVATTASATQINLSWTDNANNELGFVIERCTGAGCSDFAVIDSIAENLTAFVDPTLVAEESYSYRVRSYTVFAPSAESNVATATTRVPAAPTGLVATTQSNTAILLTWDNEADNETGFAIDRCTGEDCTDFVTVATVGANVELYENGGLDPNTFYRFRVRATNAAGSSGPSEIAEATTNLPAIPSDLDIVLTAANAIRLTWIDNANDELDQRIERCEFNTDTPCTDLIEIAIRPADVTEFLEGGLTDQFRYRYRIRARNGAGFSDYSEIVTITVDRPPTPTAFTATTVSGTQVDLLWNDVSDNEDGFRIERCAGVGCGAFAELATVPRNTSAFSDASVVVGEFYSYRIIGVNVIGDSYDYSSVASVNTMPADAPTDLVATTFSATRIDLTWTDNGPYETSYELERCVGAGCTDFALLATLGADAVDYEDAGLSGGLTYRYRVRAVNPVGPSAYSTIAGSETNLPADPTALTAVAITTSRIDLAWTDNATNETNYIVQRCIGAGCVDFADLALLGANVLAYADETVVADVSYGYRVRAFNGFGFSGFSNFAYTNTLAPAAPTGLVATTVSGERIDLAWTDNANNDLAVEVERCEGVGCMTFALLATLPANATSYEDSALPNEDAYTYRVRATNNIAVSGYSNEATANNLRPASPSSFAATTISADQIDLAWTANANNEDGYVVERCTGEACEDWQEHALLPPNATGFQDQGLEAEQVFRYLVFAYNISGRSDAIAPVTATTSVPAAPTDLALTVISASQIDLTWTDNATSEDGYRIERCTGIGCTTFIEIATVGAGVTFFASTELTINSFYRFRVRAFNAAGPSAYTEIENADTFAPVAPSALTATTILGSRVDLSWTDNSGNEAGFRIERCLGTDCTGFVEIATVGTSVTTYQDLGVAEGNDYRYRVRAFNGVNNSAFTAPVAASTVVPAAPTGLVAVATSQTSISLTWTDNATDEAGYRVERCAGAGCGDFAEVASLGANAELYGDSDLTPSTAYRYRVRAVGNGASGYSNTADATTILPADPTDLVATPVSDSRVDLTWTDNADNEFGFQIERCAGGGCADFAIIDSVAAGVTFYANEGLTSDQSYRYRVLAYNGAGQSGYATAATEATTNVPAIPTGLTAATISDVQMNLGWMDNSADETGFVVERCVGGSCTDFTTLGSVGADVQDFVDNTVTASVTYRYRVRAENANGVSGPSNTVTITSGTPAAPDNLVATTLSATRIDLAWSDLADSETSYEIERCSGVGCGGVDFAPLATEPSNTTAYSDETVTLGNSYTYRVRAVNAIGPSSAPEVTATTFVPAAPTGLIATTISATQVDLAWTDNADNELSYRVERCTGATCSDFAEIALLGADATAYSDMGLPDGLTFQYRVFASNNVGDSDPSDVVPASTDFPLPPTALSATTVTGTRIDLAWTDNATNEDEYQIERCEGEGCDAFVSLQTVVADVSEYSDESVVVGASYSYRVRAVNLAGASDYTNVATANTILPPTPTLVSAVAVSGTAADLEWENVAPATGVRIERCLASACTFAEIAVVDEPNTTFTNTGLTAGEVYLYQIRAYNNAGASDPSAGVEVRTLPPLAPSNLLGVALSTTQIRIRWDDNSTDETQFRITRCDGSPCVVYTLLATVDANEVTFVDEGLTPGMTYNYRVVAANAIGVSDSTNIATIVLVAPANATGLTATTTSGSAISLQWNDNSDNERGFAIERCAGAECGSFVQITSVGPDVTTFENTTGIALNTIYRYRVRAFNNIGPSAYTNIAEANTVAPVAPTGLAAQTLSGTGVRLTWADNASDELGYRVFRCIGVACSEFAEIDVVGPDAVEYEDLTLTFNTVYRYVVRAYNIAGPSNPSNAVQASTVLAMPLAVRALTYDRTSVRVRWIDAAVFEDGYEVEGCEGIGCSNFALVATTAANDTSALITGLNAESEYAFRVRATSPDGPSTYSGVSGARMPIEIPGDALLTGIADTANGQRHYVVVVPPGTEQLRVRVTPPPGSDPDLYVRLELSPFQRSGSFVSDTLCVPWLDGSVQEQCTFANPEPGDWFVMVHAFGQPIAGVSMSVTLGATDFTFTNCSQAGPTGPSQAQCNADYTGTSLNGRVAVSDGVQAFTTLHSGRYEIIGVGAQGASGAVGFAGGSGTSMRGLFEFGAGTTLRFAVGQAGSGQASGTNGGGGGGSFVVNVADVPLLIAGGGGGTRVDAQRNGCDANTGGFAIGGSGDQPTYGCAVKAVELGLGGRITSPWQYGSGGGGFFGNGEDDYYFDGVSSLYGQGGFSWANGLLGGSFGICGSIAEGGFGGGATGAGCFGGGGGGGYSGGDGGWIAGGGGSLNTGTDQMNTAGVGTGHGSIIIRYLGPVIP